MSLLTRLISVRVHSKKDDFVAPVDPPKKVNPIKKENIWAIRPDEDKE